MGSPDVLPGGWTATSTAPSPPTLRRTRVEHPDEGQAELIGLHPPSSFSAADHTAWVEAVTLTHPSTGPGSLIAKLEVDGRPMWLRRPLADGTLNDVRARLTPEQVAWVGAELFDAVLERSEAHGGVVHPGVIALTPSGEPVLAGPALPSTPIDPVERPFVAPETLASSTVGPESGLYGLGVSLYQLLTGRPPLSVPSGSPPPPSTLRAGVPDALDRAVTALLSPEPAQRLAARGWLDEVAEPTDLTTHQRSASSGMSPGTVKLTTSSSSSTPALTSASTDDLQAVVMLPASAITSLDASERARLAGRLGLSVTAIATAEERGTGLVVDGLPHRRAAERRAEALREQTGLPFVAQSGGLGAGFVGLIIAGLLTGLGGAALSLPLIPLLGQLAVIPVGLLLLLAAALVAGGVALAVRNRGQWSALAAAWRTRTGSQSTNPSLVSLRGRIADIRERVSAIDLPEAAAVDLRGALREVERHVEGLEEIDQRLHTALEGVDLPTVRDRLRAADHAGDTASRDRLAGTLADLEALDARRAALEGETGQVHAALDELVVTLGQLAGSSVELDDSALEALQRTTRLTRAALAPVASDNTSSAANRAAQRASKGNLQ